MPDTNQPTYPPIQGFFDETPVGRLLQRFSRDLDMIDSNLPSNLASVVTSFLSIFGAMATILL